MVDFYLMLSYKENIIGKKKFINKIKRISNDYNNDIISFDEYRSVRVSYLEHLGYGCCNSLCYEYIK